VNISAERANKAEPRTSRGAILSTSPMIPPHSVSGPGKVRTITLSERPPVRIHENDWPILTSARETENEGEEIIHWWLTVRRHVDGRTIVYARMEISNDATKPRNVTGGEVLPKGADIAFSLSRIGRECHCPSDMIAHCVADLPAQDL
jgi:hypothetical protein